MEVKGDVESSMQFLSQIVEYSSEAIFGRHSCIFCTSYFKQYEEKMEAESLNKMMSLKQKQSDKEISLIKQNEKNIALLRHDMRHFFSNILNYIENDESEQAKEYIHSIIESVDSTAIKKYCSNETVNMILSSYENDIIENHIERRTRILFVIPICLY